MQEKDLEAPKQLEALEDATITAKGANDFFIVFNFGSDNSYKFFVKEIEKGKATTLTLYKEVNNDGEVGKKTMSSRRF